MLLAEVDAKRGDLDEAADGTPKLRTVAGGVLSRRMGGGALHGLEARIPEGRTDWNLPVRVNVLISDFGTLERGPIHPAVRHSPPDPS